MSKIKLLFNSKNIVDNLERKVHNLSYLHEISHAINTFQDCDSLLDYSLSKALESLDSQSGSIFLWDESTQELRLRKVIGRDKKELEGIKQRLGEGIAGLVAKDKKPILVKNIKTDPRFHSKNSNAYKTNSFLCVPMVARDKLVGVINVTEKTSQIPFTTDELEFLFILANHIAIAADNIGLYEKVKLFNKHLEHRIKDATCELQKTIDHCLVLQRYKEDILESLTTGIYVLDRDNRITLWNHGMELKYGLKREDVLGKHFFDILKNVKPEVLSKAIEEVYYTGRHMILDSVKHRINGNSDIRTINYNIFPLRRENKSNLGVVVLLDDVTDKVRMEQELRTNEKMAAIGKLSSGIAHELNNPLDGTRRYLNLALDALRSDDNLPREFVLSAKEGVNRMIKIVRSLLEFARQTTNIVPCSVNVNDVLCDVIRFVQTDPSFAHIKVSTALSEDLLPVVDYGIQNVFSNIINNAIDAMPEKGQLFISSESLDDNHTPMVKIVIRDTGKGIPSDVIDRVFEPFFTTKKMGDGTGLGLAICQEIVTRANGQITVTSEINKGTEVSILLPITHKVHV